MKPTVTTSHAQHHIAWQIHQQSFVNIVVVVVRGVVVVVTFWLSFPFCYRKPGRIFVWVKKIRKHRTFFAATPARNVWTRMCHDEQHEQLLPLGKVQQRKCFGDNDAVFAFGKISHNIMRTVDCHDCITLASPNRPWRGCSGSRKPPRRRCRTGQYPCKHSTITFGRSWHAKCVWAEGEGRRPEASDAALDGRPDAHLSLPT